MNNYHTSPYFRIKNRKVNYRSMKTQCIQLEKNIFNFINSIRQEPSQIFSYFEKAQNPNYNNSFETQQIFEYINILTEKKISLSPLIQHPELSKISNDLLNYILSKKKVQGRIKYNDLDEEYINLRMRAAPYGRICGKYYEAIILDSTDLLEIISYIIKDLKGRNVLFNEKIKYIGIACGYFEKKSNENVNSIYYGKKINKICTVIDLIQDFESNDSSMSNDINFLNSTNIDYETANPDIFMETNSIFKDKNQERLLSTIEKSNSTDKIPPKGGHIKKYNLLSKDADNNNTIEIKKITVNKSPLLTHDKNFTSTYSSNFYFPKSNTHKQIPPLASFATNIKNEKFYFNSKKNSEKDLYNKYPFYSQNKFSKKNIKENHKYISDYLSDNNETNTSECFVRAKSTKKKLNKEEKITLLKQINKVSRDKSKNKNQRLKNEDDSKSVSLSYNTKKNISNDISFSDLISSNDNDKKLKNEKNIKELLKIQLKNEIKKEIEKEVKEELKAELINKMLLNNALKNKVPNLRIPINNNININGNSYDFGLLNNTNYTEGKNIDYNTNRSISSIDIFFPSNKNIATNGNDTSPTILNYTNIDGNTNYVNNKDNFIMKKLVKLYNDINTSQIPKNHLQKNKSYTNNNNNNNKNVYYKIPVKTNSSFYSNNNKQDQSYFYNFNNSENIVPKNKKIINLNQKKVIKLYNGQNLVNSKSNSPKQGNSRLNMPFRRMIVKNNTNLNNISTKYEKISYDKLIKIPKKIINELNYINDNSIIINNKTNNILYIKQNSPHRITNLGTKGNEQKRIYEKKINYIKYKNNENM